MDTNDRLRAGFISYSRALRQLTQLLRKSNPNKRQPALTFELAAQAHLNTIIFRKFYQQIAPDLMKSLTIQQLEDLNSPPRGISEVLKRASTDLSAFQWDGRDVTLEDLALFAAISPTQSSVGAYFTPPPLAKQICQETIANWVWSVIPDALQKLFSTGIREMIADQNYLTGSAVEVFFTQFPICCQTVLKNQDQPQIFVETLHLQFSSGRILDPACGSGIFLAEVVKVLFKLFQQLNAAVGLDIPENVLAREICTSNLYGVDLMPEYVRVARNLTFLTLLPHLKAEDLIPSFSGLCQHIQCANFLLSPFRERLTEPVPAVLSSRILIEIATCFLDVVTQSIEWKTAESTNLENYARGPIYAIPDPAWREIAGHLGILASAIKKENLPGIILRQLLPPLALEKVYDIILGNPPQEGARKETGRQEFTSWTSRVQRLCIKYLQKSQVYSDLQGAWDFSLPFVIHSMELLAPRGTLAFILPRSVGTQSFARRFLEKNLHKVRRVAYFDLQSKAIFEAWDSTRQEFLPIGNNFLVLSCSNSPSNVIRFKVEDLFPLDYTRPSLLNEIRQGDDAHNFLAQPPNMPKLQGIPLNFFVTITKGATLCAKAEWRQTRGMFKIRDLISNIRDSNHPLRFVEPTHIAPFFIAGESYLEYHHAQYPNRVPANIHRWREDAFFHGPLLVTPLSKRVPSFALIPATFEPGTWRSPETVVLFKRWADWFCEFPDNLPPAIERMKKEAIAALQQVIPRDKATDRALASKILVNLSEMMPLEVLVMILSSRPVHELRLRGGKSFGKFEVGDWEKIPLPLLNSQEVAKLLEAYHIITQTLTKIRENTTPRGRTTRRKIEPGESLKVLTRTLEKILFNGTESGLKIKRKDISSASDFDLIRSHLEQSSRLVEGAYARNNSTLENLGFFLKSNVEF